MASDQYKSFSSQLKAAFRLGQEKLVGTTRLGRKMIQGGLLANELHQAYKVLGERIYQDHKKGASAVPMKDLETYFQRIDAIKEQIKKEEMKIQKIKGDIYRPSSSYSAQTTSMPPDGESASSEPSLGSFDQFDKNVSSKPVKPTGYERPSTGQSKDPSDS